MAAGVNGGEASHDLSAAAAEPLEAGLRGGAPWRQEQGALLALYDKVHLFSKGQAPEWLVRRWH